MYSIKLTVGGLADLKSLSKKARSAIKTEIDRKLKSDPYGCSSELKEPLQDFRSFHTREYRVIFKVYDDLRMVAIAGIAKRLPDSAQDIFRRLEALASKGKLAEKILAALRGRPQSPIKFAIRNPQFPDP